MWLRRCRMRISGAVPSRSFGRKSGSQLRHRVVEAELALFDQRQRRRRDDRLGEGGEAEDRVARHRHAGLAIELAGGAGVDFLAVVIDEHDRADDPLLARSPGR